MSTEQSTENPWERFRRLMPIARRWAYFDHAAVAPLSGPAQRTLVSWAEEAAQQADTRWPVWASRVEQVRERAAWLIGAEAAEIALVPNTTAGINLVAEGFPWREGDNVVTPANEFPTNQYPWLNLAARGVQTRRVAVDGARVDLDRLLDACDERTRIISVSWVGYATGWRIDVDQLVERAHARGILVFLDAIQGLGVFPLDVRRTPIDFLAADGHKWLLGPEGAGIFFVRQQHLDLLRPIGVGWHSVVHASQYDRIELRIRPDAARYEGGSQNMAGVLALGASLDMLASLGLSPARSPIADRVLEIHQQLVERLQAAGAHVFSPTSGPNRSGIISFTLPDRDLAQLRRRCLEAGVVLSRRDGRLRLSPHGYINQSDIDRLFEALGR